MTNTQLDTSYAEFKIQDGVLCMSYKKGLMITQKIAREIVETRLNFSNHEYFPLLIIDQGIIGMDKSARDHLSSKEGTSKITASALVLNTVYSRVLGNFFIKLTRPTIPVRIFNDKAKAMEWLQAYRMI
jgi:hypothetical protein